MSKAKLEMAYRSLSATEAREAALKLRVDVLEGLLREASVELHDFITGPLLDRIDAALKPAEGGGDEGCSACGSSANDWNCNQCKPF